MSDSTGAGALRAPGLQNGIRVVLLGPKRGSNVGAACRAIKNMGASALVIVGGDYDTDEARRTAVHAGDVFDARVDAASFEDAVAASTLVVGTTSRSKPWSIPVEPIGEVLSQTRSRGIAAGEIALVFGPEDRGLSNEELSRCHRLAFVPTASEYASLNLAQAVVVCLYEWLRSAGEPARPQVAAHAPACDAADPPRGDASCASASAQADAIADLRSVLEEIDFLHGDQGERVMATVTSMLTRGGLDDREVAILRGIVRQIRWAARRHAKV